MAKMTRRGFDFEPGPGPGERRQKSREWRYQPPAPPPSQEARELAGEYVARMLEGLAMAVAAMPKLEPLPAADEAYFQSRGLQYQARAWWEKQEIGK
jgi:hypothetical protein